MGLLDPHNKLVIANQPDIVLVDRQEKKAVVVDTIVPSDSNIKKKEHKKYGKYQGLKEELERIWGIKAGLVPMVVGALQAATSRLGD